MLRSVSLCATWSSPDRSLYLRQQADAVLPDGTHAAAWVYFCNAPMGGATRIASGDCLEHTKIR
jgi:gamma-glutamylcyclotransferase (GGCT)/AIG2-like uncharacterized protein YtfP